MNINEINQKYNRAVTEQLQKATEPTADDYRAENIRLKKLARLLYYHMRPSERVRLPKDIRELIPQIEDDLIAMGE